MRPDVSPPDRSDPLRRIDRAWDELGHTDVDPTVARRLVAVFLVAILLAPATQLVVEPTLLTRSVVTLWGGVTAPSSVSTRSAVEAIAARNRTLLESIQDVEDRIADDSLATRFIRPAVQLLLTASGAGTAQVLHGRGDWLFFGPDLMYVTGPGFLEPRQLRRRERQGDTVTAAPQPDPRPALFGLDAQLARREIALVVMPTPVKPSVEWKALSGTRQPRARLPNNVSHRAFVEELRDRGLLVFDVAEMLGTEEAPAPRYLQTDTHWRPETVERVAARLAAFLRVEGLMAEDEPVGYRTVRATATSQGDTARLLDLPAAWSQSYQETVTVRQILTDDGTPWQADPEAGVLLLGDSFTNVYSIDALGWGGAAGLAEQLSYELQRPVDRLAQNDNGAVASRELLATELRRGRDRLSGKRVVILQFAARELSLGDWRPVDLAPGITPLRDTFIQSDPGRRLAVRGTIADIGRMPRPGTVPYRDHIVGVHLVDVTVTTGESVDGDELLVYLWSMQDNEQTPVADYRIGDSVALTIESWDAVAATLDGINRDEVSDPAARLAPPWWASAAGGATP